MGIKEIKIKKSFGTLFGVVVGLLMVMAMFYGMYSFINSNAEESGKILPSQYNDTQTRLQEAEDDADTNIQNIKLGVSNLTEADASFASAWNGLKGLVQVVKLPLNFVDMASRTVDIMTMPLVGVLPTWAKTLIGIGIAGFIIFIIWSIFKGDSNIIR